MAEQTQVGIILEGPAQRDAIHIAIAPVIAGEKLTPGSHVGFIKDGNTELVGVRTKETIGVVDPFIKGFVQVGQRFYLFLYPQTITSLKHMWSHPAFKDEIPVYQAKKQSLAVEASIQWLKDFCRDHDCPSYKSIIELVESKQDSLATVDNTEYGDYTYGLSWDNETLHSSGSDAHGDIPEEFWYHIEVVTGIKPKFKPTHFACSC